MPTDVNLASTMPTGSLSTVSTVRPTAAAPASAAPQAPVDRMMDERFWRETFPELSIGTLFSGNFEINFLGDERDQRVADRMRIEGYFQEGDEALVDLSQRLSTAIERAHSMGIPPVFIFLFDEAWAAFYRQHATLSAQLGEGYRVLPDFWAWRVDPRAGQAGWRPHRDKGSIALRADGTPKAVTMWIPLTEATPLNGCMYVVPADRDPVYGTELDNNNKHPMDFPSIRALPARPGEYLCWNQAVLHWGAQSSQFGGAPRMSMAMEFQRADEIPFNEPLIPTLAVLPYIDRLRLCAKQILQYAHMYPLPQPMQDLAERILKP